MSRVEAASGAKYSTHKEQARKFEPIAPVGTNYTPVGKVDIGALRKAPTPAAKPPPPAAGSRPTFGAKPPAASASSLYGRTIIGGSAPQDAWPEDKPTQVETPPPPPPITASRPPVLPTVSRPAFSAQVSLATMTWLRGVFISEILRGPFPQFQLLLHLLHPPLHRTYLRSRLRMTSSRLSEQPTHQFRFRRRRSSKILSQPLNRNKLRLPNLALAGPLRQVVQRS